MLNGDRERRAHGNALGSRVSNEDSCRTLSDSKPLQLYRLICPLHVRTNAPHPPELSAMTVMRLAKPVGVAWPSAPADITLSRLLTHWSHPLSQHGAVDMTSAFHLVLRFVPATQCPDSAARVATARTLNCLQ